MKLKQLSAFSMLLFISFIITSCGTNREAEKLLVGKWNPVTVENLAVPPDQPPATQVVKVDTSTEEGVRKETELTLPATPTKAQEKVARYMANEKRSPVVFSIKDNKRTVVKEVPGKTVSGTWKLKKNGKKLAVKEDETGRKVNVDILSLTDSTTVLVEKLPIGDVKIKYSKVK
jgi:hypothetical protein